MAEENSTNSKSISSISGFRSLLFPQTQSVQRDIAFSVSVDTNYTDIEKVIKKCTDKAIFKAVQVFDVYEGENIEKGQKSIAVRVTLQNDKETLKDTQIDAEITKIRTALEKTVPSLKLR